MTKPRLFAFALVAAVALWCVAPASAVPFVFPDRADFDVAFPGSTIENWDSYVDGTLFPTGSTTAGITYGGDAGVTDSFLASSGANTLGRITPEQEFFNPGDTITFAFDTPLQAFGIDINTASQDSDAYTATTDTGEVFFSAYNPFPSSAFGQFIGFSTAPFTSVTITGNTPFGFTLDTLRASPVPEPTTMLLIGSGLAGLLARRSRHRKPSSTSS